MRLVTNVSSSSCIDTRCPTYHTMMLFTSILLAAATASTTAGSYEAPFGGVRGVERLLGHDHHPPTDPSTDTDTEFDYFKVYYDPHDKECWLEYKVTGHHDEVRVDFDAHHDEIEEDHDKVTCTKIKEHTNGVSLPLEEDVPLDHATWVSEVVRAAYVTWSDHSKELQVKIKRFSQWEAGYDPHEHRPCWLKYNYGHDHGDRTKIEFRESEVSVHGDVVTCKTDDLDGKLPHGLTKLEKDIPNHNVEWVGNEVEDADVTWEEGHSLKLEIERERAYTGREAFDDLRLVFDDLEQVVVFTYRLKGEHKEHELVYEGEEQVTEDGLTVMFESMCDEAPEGLDLPVKLDFEIDEVTWGTRCDRHDTEKTIVVESASFTWFDKCDSHDDGHHMRRLQGDSGRTEGDITAKGR